MTNTFCPHTGGLFKPPALPVVMTHTLLTVLLVGCTSGVYAGEKLDGKRHQRTMTYSDGAKYESEWKDGKRHGQGTLTWSDGSNYEGEWKDGKKHGHGIDIEGRGQIYEGESKNGKHHGYGTYTWYDGRKLDYWNLSRNTYEGEWNNGKKHGQGTLTFSDGSSYIGEWKDDKKWNGTQTDKKGEITGKWVNGE